MQRVERRVEIRHKQLRRQGRQKSLSICPKVGRDLCTLSDADVLQQAEHEHGQHLEVFRDGELSASTGASRSHARLVRLQYLDHLVEEGVAAILELVGDTPLDRLVREERCNGDLVSRRKYFRQVAGRREGSGDNANAALA